MGDKYIIELEDKPFYKEDGDFLYRVKGFNSLVFDMTGISKLTPYTEPDLERVRKEAYEKGFDAGRMLNKGKYEKGLTDAWEAARKIYLPTEYGGIPAGTLRQMFDNKSIKSIFMKVSASEAIEKIRQYEQEQEEQIQVGDEVTAAFGNAVVTEVETEHIYYFYKDGSYGSDKKKNVKKTGRHFPEIAEVLAKMREG